MFVFLTTFVTLVLAIHSGAKTNAENFEQLKASVLETNAENLESLKTSNTAIMDKLIVRIEEMEKKISEQSSAQTESLAEKIEKESATVSEKLQSVPEALTQVVEKIETSTNTLKTFIQQFLENMALEQSAEREKDLKALYDKEKEINEELKAEGKSLKRDFENLRAETSGKLAAKDTAFDEVYNSLLEAQEKNRQLSEENQSLTGLQQQIDTLKKQNSELEQRLLNNTAQNVVKIEAVQDLAAERKGYYK